MLESIEESPGSKPRTVDVIPNPFADTSGAQAPLEPFDPANDNSDDDGGLPATTEAPDIFDKRVNDVLSEMGSQGKGKSRSFAEPAAARSRF